MKTIVKYIIAMAIAVAASQHGMAQTLVNGSFESGDYATWDAGTYFKKNSATNPTTFTLDGWTRVSFFAGGIWGIKTGNATFGNSIDGDRFIGLNVVDANPTNLYQQITNLVVGQAYSITGWVRARNAASAAGTWAIALSDTTLVTAANINAVITNPTERALAYGNPTAGVWTSFSGQFVATSESVYLNIIYGGVSADRTALFDGIAITAIPEPQTYAMLFGVLALGSVLFTKRLRRQ